MNGYHIPVLLNEAITFLDPAPGTKFVDCTLGGGGHTEGLLKRGAVVLGIDRDPEAIENARKNFQSEISNFQLILRNGNFENLIEIVNEVGWHKVDGVLMDLGVSSHQLETDYRGFSFNQLGPLDMRMDQASLGPTALDLIKAGSEKELANIFEKFGEERFSKTVAREIKKIKIETTDDLAKAILRVRARSKDRTHPATRVFQALRIVVNDELNSLKNTLPQVVKILNPGGKLAVISFHSLEDRIVKQFMGTSELIRPTDEEIQKNTRARSGKLRVYTLRADSDDA